MELPAKAIPQYRAGSTVIWQQEEETSQATLAGRTGGVAAAKGVRLSELDTSRRSPRSLERRYVISAASDPSVASRADAR